ncbi:FAD-binding oxidoreductase [Pontibacter diazotrophicus]|uniref:FAD-binding oxidoreductase n=1 Tax=Pontibacter diazotrophicus TaxID=1400979 RepID=A0A3D8L358_9BACT|nr:FAD-binding oxidoreductase [Pontibacter diazotrophicus]RDV11841.1 FAD-binding oxidoreductase [Pontibacter diazotrophicus]
MATATTKSASVKSLGGEILRTFKSDFRGELLQPGDKNYNEARKVYNAMIDKQPGLIAYCSEVADVVKAVRFAGAYNLDVAVRAGGHNGAGLGMCEDGLCIDLSKMKLIRVNQEANTVLVEGGCTWGEVDQATHAYGLAMPSGIISTTGVGGLTLGGGHGHLSRKYGLTIDNLLEAEIVLATGEVVTANEQEHQDLFWAVRGGGGNFGVVTSFLFRLHPVSTVYAGPMFWELGSAPEILKWYREFLPAAPEELNGFFAFMAVPPAPSFPEHLHLQKVCGIVWCHCGKSDQAEETLSQVREKFPPIFEHVGAMPYPALQSAFDALYPKGHNWYWRGDFVKEIPDEAIEQHVKFANELPTMQSTMHLYPVDGAVNRVGKEDTAFSFREANWSQVIVGVDPDAKNNERITQWAKDYWKAIHPYSLGGAYVNFMMEEGQERVKATYRDNYDRLLKVKQKYDPSNFFHLNQNIKA